MDGLLGERLNGEPVVFRGYTDSELLLAVAVSSGFWFPVAAAVGWPSILIISILPLRWVT